MASPSQLQEWLIHRWSEPFLSALLSSPDGIATTDRATPDLRFRFEEGGKWRGQIPKRISTAGIIVEVGAVKSSRTPRHGGLTTVWRLIDRPAALQELDRIRRWLAEHPAPSQHPDASDDRGFSDPNDNGPKQQQLPWPASETK